MDYPGISLDDAKAFGVTPDECRSMWIIATNHQSRMETVVAGGWNNSPTVVRTWEMECRWRTRCWCLLDDALFCNLTDQTKRASLSALRDLLGEADYYGGRMPAPICSYRPQE